MKSAETTNPLGYNTILEWMEAQRAALDSAIASFRDWRAVAGAQPGEHGFASGQAQALIIAPGEVPTGAFHGKSLPEAAVLYLQIIKQKQKASDIAAALLRGGIHTKAKPGKFNNQVHALLDRASKKQGADLMKLPDAYWGLREWLPPSVRASMAASYGSKPKRGRKKKAASRSTAKPSASPGQSSKRDSANDAESGWTDWSAPKPDSAEGRIFAAIRRQPTKEWTAKEIAAAADIPRIQTTFFLLGKLAHRKLIANPAKGVYRSI